MNNEENPGSVNAARARMLAEQALHAQAAGQVDEADRLFSEAQRLDPDVVAVVLSEHDAAVAPDARDTPAANHDAERVRHVAPRVADPAARPDSAGRFDPRS
jgi:hypothetical protein